jgi:hypothetical protein
MPRHLYRYFSDPKHADDFADGLLLFKTLAYYRDYEDNGVRGDKNEGTSIYRPSGGLVVNNQTKGTTFTLDGSAFEASARAQEIFVYCLSKSFNDFLWNEFEAKACVEISCTATFCRRISLALPEGASCPGPAHRQRLGHHVEYYNPAEVGGARWALPDKIATAKSRDYSVQDEFRLAFGLNNAFAFEHANYRIADDSAEKVADPSQHHSHFLRAQSLRDICRIHTRPRSAT